MVNSEKGAALLKQTKRILKKQRGKQTVRHPAKGYTMPDHRPEPRAGETADPALSSFTQVDLIEKTRQHRRRRSVVEVLGVIANMAQTDPNVRAALC